MNPKNTLFKFIMSLLFTYPLLIIKDSLYFPMELPEILYTTGKYCGFIAYFIFFLQYLWTAKVKFLEHIIPFDSRVKLHRSMGFIGLLVLTLHPLLILSYYVSLGSQLIIDIYIGLGFLAFILILIIGGSTFLGKMFSVKYETWKGIHWISFSVLTLGFFHSLMIGSDIYSIHKTVWILLWSIHILLVLLKFVHKVVLKYRTYSVESVVFNTDNITTLKIGYKGNFHPGQFVFLSVKQDKKWSGWHPFSISTCYQNREISFSIKNLGDFSSKINEINVGDIVRIDLPYGGFTYDFYNDQKYNFIAAGIGITPIFSMISSLDKDNNSPELNLLYGAHSEDDILFKNEIDDIFVRNSKWNLKYVISSQKNWKGIKGHITADNLKELCNYNLDGTFFICGPMNMVISLTRKLRDYGIKKDKIRSEQFKFIP